MFEHYLFMELYAHKNLNLLDYPIQYWRTKSGHEVDFILNNGQLAIECKMANSIHNRDFSGLLAFKKDFPKAELLLVCREPDLRMVTIDGVKIKIYPVKSFLMDLWAGKMV